MRDFALWRAFDKRVLEELQVPPDLLHDQDRLRTAELRTFAEHATVLNGLRALAPRLHQLSKTAQAGTNAPLNAHKFGQEIAHMISQIPGN